MFRALALLLASLIPAPPATAQSSFAAPPFRSSIAPLPAPVRTELRHNGFWRSNCPVSLSSLRVLTLTYRDFEKRVQSGQLVLNRVAARPLASVFHKLYAHHFPIHHMQLADMYGPERSRPRDGDVTGSFSCRQAVPSPCTGGKGTGSWSMHAYGLAVDLNPVENPYVGCGESRDPLSRPYRDRSRHRRGMVTSGVIGAFASIGWGWGGSWSGSTKDYMHFSSTGH